MNKYRTEYPRPDFVRKNWKSLNGSWAFDFDDKNIGPNEHWEDGHKYSKKIVVPFCFQSELSGIGDTSFHDYFYYEKKFRDPRANKSERLIINFEGTDYFAKVYINGKMVINHEGGNTRFSADITDFVHDNKNRVTVYCFDPSQKKDMPRGKQYWKEKSESIWYTRTSGIWKSAWLEWVNTIYIKSCLIRTDIELGIADIDLELSAAADVKVIVTDNSGNTSDIQYISGISSSLKIRVRAFDALADNSSHLWSPSNPCLYMLKMQLLNKNGDIIDEANTYFGMRKIEAKDGFVYLNNKPYFQKLVLDQGYWPDGIMTPKSVECLKDDILKMKEMGFNGCRKHQKVEDPYFYYFADKYGFLIWNDVTSAFEFSDSLIPKIEKEMTEEIVQLRNHPSLIAWVAFNESWGIDQIANDKIQQHFADAMYFLAKSLDPDRFVISNDGWQHTFSDLITIHNYRHGQTENDLDAIHFKDVMTSREKLLTDRPTDKSIMVDGYMYSGQPLIISEFGGVQYEPKDIKEGWGYTISHSQKDYLDTLNRIFSAICSSHVISGFCYTQLSDVEQEHNGLLTYDRKDKVDPNKIRKINEALTFLPQADKTPLTREDKYYERH